MGTMHTGWVAVPYQSEIHRHDKSAIFNSIGTGQTNRETFAILDLLFMTEKFPETFFVINVNVYQKS